MKNTLRLKNSLGWFLGLWWLAVAAQAQMATNVVINELLANNVTSITNADGKNPDLVEFYNPTAQAVSLASLTFTDDLLEPGRYRWPAGATIAAKGFSILWCDKATNLGGYHTGWGLKKAGGVVALFKSTTQRLDVLGYGFQAPDISLGRVPDGSANFAPCTLTFKAANRAWVLGSPAVLKINEWLAAPAGYTWFELYNPSAQVVGVGGLFFAHKKEGSGVPTDYSPVADWSFIEPHGYRRIWTDAKDHPADHVTFELSPAGGWLALYGSSQSNAIDQVQYGVPINNVSQGRLPNGSSNIVSFPLPSPGAPNFPPLTNVVINEVLGNGKAPMEDAIELYNTTAAPVNIGSWWLSDSIAEPKKYRIPAGTILPARGYAVFYAYQFDPYGTGHSPYFNLSSKGGDAYLLVASNDAAGTLLGSYTAQSYGATDPGISYGRFVTSQGVDFTPMNRQTFGTGLLPNDPPDQLPIFRTGQGATNSTPKIGPVVISEIMYHPPALTNSDVPFEYIKLSNVSIYTANLWDTNGPYGGLYYDIETGTTYADGRTNTWHMGGDHTYAFPTGTAIPSGAFVLVVSFNPFTNAAHLADFRARYGLPASTRIFGPMNGKLFNNVGTVQLLKPGTPAAPGKADVGVAPYILVDSVSYSDHKPWPKYPDGGDAADNAYSLERINLRAYANDPANWQARRIQELNAPQLFADGLLLSFYIDANKSYSLQYQNNLLPGGKWTTLTNVPAQTNSTLIRVSVSTTVPKRFFRLVTPAQL